MKAYAKVYSKKADGKYKDLEFAYLVELSKIDALLRKEILNLSLDVEHYLKSKFITDISECDPSVEDGYTIVETFMSFDRERKRKIDDKGLKSTCTNLVKKYKEDYAVWQLVELLLFSDVIELYRYFYKSVLEKQCFDEPYGGLLMPVKFLRNAAAHNNCLIIHLRERNMIEHAKPQNKHNQQLNARVGQIYKAHKGDRIEFMKNQIIHDFIALLVVYNSLAPESSRRKTMQHLKDVFCGRMLKHKDYFIGNKTIVSTYKFVKIAINHYADAKEKNNLLTMT